MHISEGVLSPAVLAGGAALAVAGAALGLKKMSPESIPRVAILSSAFFVASLIHVPLGPVSMHLVLNGLMGLFLGLAALPAILVALALQAVLFQFGGITVLGVNTVIMGFPAVACYFLCRPLLRRRDWGAAAGAFTCGALAVLGSGLLAALALVTTGEAFVPAAKLVVVAHIPVMLIEGLITMFAFSFIRKVRPDILGDVYD